MAKSSTSFGAGNRANPKGRPKSLTEWRASDHARRLRQVALDALELAATSALRSADRIVAAREILDRTDGKPIAAVEISGPDGERTTFNLSVFSTEQLEQFHAMSQVLKGGGGR